MNGFFYEWETQQRHREEERSANLRHMWRLDGGVAPRRGLFDRLRRAEAAPPPSAAPVAATDGRTPHGPLKKAS